MKIGIIGLGFIGQMIAKALTGQEGVETYGFTSSPEKLSDLSKLVDHMSLLDFDKILDLDILIVSVAPKPGASYEETYLKTAQEIAKRHPRWVIYTGSTSVYGPGTVSEESPLCGNQVLIETEKVYQTLNSTILRLGGIYGEGRELRRKVNRIHAKDIVRGVLFTIEHQMHGVFNLCIGGVESDKFVLNDKIRSHGFTFEYTD